MCFRQVRDLERRQRATRGIEDSFRLGLLPMAARYSLAQWANARCMTALPPKADVHPRSCYVAFGRVEDGRGSLGHAATLRFPSPLIEPDVPISGIRLSDRLHREAHDEGPMCTRLRCSTPSSPKTVSRENRCVPRPCTLCRLTRKCRTRSWTC